MLKENKPLVSEVASLAEVKTGNPSFVLVGNPDDFASVKGVASKNKANMSFYFIKELEGSAEGSVLFVEDGKITETLEKGGDVSAFVGK